MTSRDSRRGTRTPTGPGRFTRRSRAGSAPVGTPEPRRDTASVTEVASAAAARIQTFGMRITRRALTLTAVLVVLALAYANSLRVYYEQARQIEVTQAQIQLRSNRVAQLEDEIRRWSDPDFVKAQARERLGWVMPGEVGYRVLGEDGKPLGAGITISTERPLPPNEYPTQWWDRLYKSMLTADKPVTTKS